MYNKKAIMIQGSSSSVGKSLITSALCRHFSKKGLKVFPFKSQNMSLNAAVSIEGYEMARAQYIQAIAASAPPSYKMNPILIKPENDDKSQIIFMGKTYKTITHEYYMYSKKDDLFTVVLNLLNDAINDNDIVVIEGAGSPVEINLKDYDITNMRIAKNLNAPVIIVCDIEKGGAFAQIVGTLELMDKSEKNLVFGYIFNKFRGDVSLLKDFPKTIAKRYGIEFLGTMPYVENKIPQEDSLFDLHTSLNHDINVNIIKLPHISNFDDFDPLILNANVRFIDNGKLDGDLIIIPGTKTTLYDFEWMKSKNLIAELNEAKMKNKYIIGICGGYQILGNLIEENGRISKGLGFLQVETHFEKEKKLANVEGICTIYGKKFILKGYEIHHGVSLYTKKDIKPFASVYLSNRTNVSYKDGVISGRIIGTYFHGLFQNFKFTETLLNTIRLEKGLNIKPVIRLSITKEIDKFLEVFKNNIEVDKIDDLFGI